MVNQRHLGKLCPFAKECPVYQEELLIDKISPFLIKNVFCNRGEKGWLGCEKHMYLNKCQE